MDSIKGKVIKGKKRGKKLGFPTANLPLIKKISQGVYISQVYFESEKYHALTFIGNATTYNEKEILAETYILDFSNNLYGKDIEVQLVYKIRGNKKFKSETELIRQMRQDELTARNFFGKHC